MSQTGREQIPTDLPLMLLSHLSERGVDAEALCLELDLDLPRMRRGEGVLNELAFTQLWRRGAELTCDPFIGLHLGEKILLHSHGHILFALIQSCPTLEISMDYFAKYHNLVHGDASEIPIEKTDTHLTIPLMEWTTPTPIDVLSQSTLAFAATLVSFIRHLSQNVLAADSVSFRFAAPKELAEIHRVLGTNVLFDQARNQIRFLRKDMQIRPVFADPELLRALESRVQRLLKNRFRSESWADKVANQLGSMLYGGDTHIDSVASALAISPRTLQSRLKEEGISFRAIWDNVRREVAEHYLKEREEPIIEVALLLGFSEQSAFTKAYKQWTGLTPNEFRRQGRSEG